MQHHVGTITKSSMLNHQFHAQCTCGTAGSFRTKDEAVGYLQGHFAKLGGIQTSELVDNSDKPEAKPALPTTHVAGVGTMPSSHAASPAEKKTGPPPPPPPPPARKPEVK